MKKVFFLITMVCCTISGYSQNSSMPGHWFLGANFKAGMLNEHVTRRSIPRIFPGTVVYNESKLKIENDNPIGFDVQLGYFFGKKATWGIGTGVVYFRNEGKYTIDSLHIEYMSTDFNKNVFRQVVTANGPITETVTNTNISVPLLVKYRTPIFRWLGLSVDAGIVYNVKMETEYKSTASFDYEAIYKIQITDGQPGFVYDASPVPHESSWLITREQYIKTKGDGQEETYFQTLQDQGYNVGLNEATTAKSTTVKHKKGTVGILIQPSFNVKLSRNLFINVGPYYMHQRFANEENDKKTMVTDKIGEYNSILLNNIKRRQSYYGLNIGIGVYF